MGDKFSPNTYWRNRVAVDATIGVVGHRSLGTEYNEFIYKRRVDVLNQVLVKYDLDPDRDAILDVGCGTGYYTRYWRSKGFGRYLGIDLSDATVNRLKHEIPGYAFVSADISDPPDGAINRETFAVITVFDVFYHIVDDKRLTAALENIRSRLAANGILIIFDQLTKDDYVLRKHVKFRSEASYLKLLKKAGLEIVEREKLFLFLVPPLYGRRALDIPIGGIYKVVGTCMKVVPFLGRFLGKRMYEIDQMLRRRNVQIPNNEVFIVRHRQVESNTTRPDCA